MSTPQFIKRFEDCKNILTNEPLLQYPDFTKLFIPISHASHVSIAGILSQESIENDKPIAYIARTLNDSEQYYSTIEKELLATI